eukprot:2814280-Prymnesium_polylepis.1
MWAHHLAAQPALVAVEARLGGHVERAVLDELAVPVLPARPLERLVVLGVRQARLLVDGPQEAVCAHLREAAGVRAPPNAVSTNAGTRTVLPRRVCTSHCTRSCRDRALRQ